VLAQRADRDITALHAPGAPADESVSAGSGDTAAAGDAEHLLRLREKHAGAMPY
jgi:hypothetical protein